MNLPSDLKNFRADDSDGFQLISPDLAVFLICLGGVLLLVMWRPM